MIASLTGRVVGRDGQTVVIDVGGVGYEALATRAAAKAVDGEITTLYTHLNVREDALQLFAFASPEERRVFRLLVGVSGVGPKLALAASSAYGPSQLLRAIAAQDVALLASVPGIGRKTAQRICVDLASQVGDAGVPAAAGEPARVPTGGDTNDPWFAARDALVALGYQVGDAERALEGSSGEEQARLRYGLGRLAASRAMPA